MAQQELEISISPDGKVTVRTIGIKGAACMDYADLLVQIVGMEQDRTKTSEFYETQQQAAHIHIRQQR